MTKITTTLLLLALGLAIPVTLLVRRALDSAAFESAVRHDAVAQRAFDEMERALSHFLEREESRTFEDYAGPRRRSSLRLAAEPFIVGYFQVDPDGSIQRPRTLTMRRRGQDRTSRREKRDRIEAALLAAWQPPHSEMEGPPAEATQRLAQRMRAPQRQAAASHPNSSGPQSDWPGASAQAAHDPAPGVTVPIGGSDQSGALGASGGQALLAESGDSAYDVLRELNIGSEMRSKRKQRKEQQPVTAQGPSFLLFAQFEFTTPPARAPTSGVALEDDTLIGPQLTLDPMVGRTGEGADLILYRTVVADSQGYRQGLLLDRELLGQWLDGQVIARSGLARVAQVQFLEAGEAFSAPSDRPEVRYYRHRFGEPFDSISAVLALEPLPGGSSITAIYTLVALLVVVGLAGLLAIWRMVAVAVHFAERRSNFASSVTHELKTPLTAIRMYAEMLRDGVVGSDEKRSEYYGTITNESERLSRLIDNVLEFSRLEKGRRELNLQVGALAPLVSENAERLKPHAEREGFSLRVEIEPDLPPVRFDRDATVQVLFNLVDNAIKYASSASQREIVLRCERRGDGVALSVRDFGPGIAKRNATRIFEPFYRGEDELTRTTKGTGIGLALVKELADRMGAAVAGENLDGGGFRVTIAFPTAG